MVIDKLLVRLGLTYLAKKLDGKKTMIGVLGKALTGVATIIAGTVGLAGTLWPDSGLPSIDQDKALATIGAGVYAVSSAFSSLGVAHKIEKATT
jgi:hypothetical protein